MDDVFGKSRRYGVTRIMEENEDIKEAKEELDKISQDDILRRMALKADLARRDYEQCMYEAKRDGIAEGRKEGVKEAKLEDAKRMLLEGIEIEKIMKITELTKEEVENLL